MPKIIRKETLTGESIHGWFIQEYERYKRTTLWYVLMITLGAIMVFLGIFSGNFLFSFIIILFGIIIFLQSYQEPPQISFEITELGLLLGEKFYPYTELREFFIIYEPPEVKTLFVETDGLIKTLLRVPLLDQNPLEVRQVLNEFLPENVDREEPVADRFSRNWRLQ